MRAKLYAALTAMLSIGACASTSNVPVSEHRIEGPSNYTVFWDLPFQDWYWVPRGTPVRAIREAAQACGAEVDGAMSHHIPVPPAFDWGVFRFVGEPSETSRNCVIERVQAVRSLTVYPRRR